MFTSICNGKSHIFLDDIFMYWKLLLIYFFLIKYLNIFDKSNISYNNFNFSQCQECASCKSDTLDCYLIDGNGYVIFSEVNNDTGRFFGEVEGAIMEAMISKNIFRHVVMFDYQATCPNESTILVNAGWNLITVSNLSQNVLANLKLKFKQLLIHVFRPNMF